MVADQRIVVDHYQDNGGLWSIVNAYCSARSSYGHEHARLSPAERRRLARWALAHITRRLRRETRAGASPGPMSAPESALVSAIAAAAGLGASAGAMLGPGRSADRVA